MGPAKRMIAVALLATACGGGATNDRGGITPPPPPPPVLTTISVTLSASTVNVGSTVTASAAGLDQNGASIATGPVTWSVGSPSVASMTSAGVVTGLAAGTTTVIAAAGGKQGQASLTVLPGSVAGDATVTITAVAPAVLKPGVPLTITGTGFSATPSTDTVTIDGVAATVTSASTVQLSAVVPTSLPCAPTHAATLRVTVAGHSATASPTLQVGTSATLAVGASTVITSASALACTELPAASGNYVVSVFNDMQVPTSTAGFRLAGTVGTGSADRVPAPVLRQAMARPAPVRVPDTGIAGLPESAAMHERVLDASRAAFAMLRSTRRAAATTARAAAGGPGYTAVPAVGATRTFRVNQFTTVLNATTTCASYKEITARVVYVGTRSILWEDVAAPLAGTMDAYFARLGQEFDATMYRSDSAYFGDPLVTDPYTDADQHLGMVFTPSMPNGVAGFVIACDLFARDSVSDPSSNFGEYFYAVVPTVAGTGFTTDTPDAWLRGMRKTVVHEVKHIASFGARFKNGASSLEESWLEEGMAREAEEVWLRNNIYHAAWKGDALYASTLYCDVRPAFPECTGAPYGLYNHMTALYAALQAPGASSLFGRVVDNDFTFYALSWSFSRWADDRYSPSDAAFLRAVTQATATTGMTTISGFTGQPVDQMLGNWVLSLYLDGQANFLANADVQFPTWNTRDLYAGMSTDFAASYPVSFPLIPLTLPSGAFAVDNTGIHGGAFAMYKLSMTGTTPQTLALLGAGGVGPAPSSLRIAIARLP